jgi:general secretion pathway protein J
MLRTSDTPRRHAGFTLLELLVALSIFALLAAMAYGGLNTVLRERQLTEQQAVRLAQLQRTFLWLSRDLEQAINRPIRDEYGDRQPALLGVEFGRYRLELTRGGWRNPAGRARSGLQRVAYGLRDGELVRVYWNVLDRAQDSEPFETALLDGIDKLELRFLDDKQQWRDTWPVTTTGSQSVNSILIAVEVTLETETEGRIMRLFQVSGV